MFERSAIRHARLQVSYIFLSPRLSAWWLQVAIPVDMSQLFHRINLVNFSIKFYVTSSPNLLSLSQSVPSQNLTLAIVINSGSKQKEMKMNVGCLIKNSHNSRFVRTIFVQIVYLARNFAPFLCKLSECFPIVVTRRKVAFVFPIIQVYGA